MKKNDETPKRPQRMPYEPPRVVSEEVFETLALTCGKTLPSDVDCVASITS